MSSNRTGQWGVAHARRVAAPPLSAPQLKAKVRTTVLIPFEHNLVFRITGKRGTLHRQVLQVSTEGEFVVDTVSYFVDIFNGFLDSNAVPPLLTGAVRTLGCEFASETIRFMFNVTDAASGRRLANLALHNICVLGLPGQKLPRQWPRPWRFSPRSEVRVELEELFSIMHARAHLLEPEADQFRTANIANNQITEVKFPIDLHISFHGHKVLRP
jgi:hypothetical protein